MTEHINAGALDAASEIAPPRGSDGKQREYASTERKVRNGFVLLLTFLLLIAAVSYYSVDNLTDNAAWVAHSHEVSNGLDRLLLATTEAETAQRGYLISGDASYLESYAQAEVAAAKAQHSLETLTADNANQQRRLSSVGKSFEERMKVSRERIEMRRTFGLEAMQRLESIEHKQKAIDQGVQQVEAFLQKGDGKMAELAFKLLVQMDPDNRNRKRFEKQLKGI